MALGLPRDYYVLDPLDPKVLASRLNLFEAEHKKVFDNALDEVEDGYKDGSWIWSVFPQATGLPEHHDRKSSSKSVEFSIDYLDEAVAFLEHPILGSNYLKIVEAVRDQLDQRGLKEIFDRPGCPDSKKVISSVTLFGRAAGFSHIVPAQADSPADNDAGLNEELSDDEPVLLMFTEPSFNEEIGRLLDRQRWELPPWLTEPGRVLMDHCDAILAKADDESLQPCSYSQEFGSSTENSWEWIGSGGSRVSPHVPFDEEEVDDAFDTRPWRGDAWSHRLVGGQ